MPFNNNSSDRSSGSSSFNLKYDESTNNRQGSRNGDFFNNRRNNRDYFVSSNSSNKYNKYSKYSNRGGSYRNPYPRDRRNGPIHAYPRPKNERYDSYKRREDRNAYFQGEKIHPIDSSNSATFPRNSRDFAGSSLNNDDDSTSYPKLSVLENSSFNENKINDGFSRMSTTSSYGDLISGERRRSITPSIEDQRKDSKAKSENDTVSFNNSEADSSRFKEAHIPTENNPHIAGTKKISTGVNFEKNLTTNETDIKEEVKKIEEQNLESQMTIKENEEKGTLKSFVKGIDNDNRGKIEESLEGNSENQYQHEEANSKKSNDEKNFEDVVNGEGHKNSNPLSPRVQPFHPESIETQTEEIEERYIDDNSKDSKAPAPDTQNSDSAPSSGNNHYDSSTLSPVGDSAPLNDPFFTSFSPIEEKRTISNKSDHDSESEAETIAADSPPRIKKGKRFIKRQDSTKFNKRRRVIDSSDDGESVPEITTTRRPYKMKRDSSGRSLLQRACEKGNLQEIKDYVARGADTNEHDFCGFTCLHEAALQGHVDVVKVLIENGANVNAQADEAGDLETPLIDAAENKHLETVKVLLEHGANPNIYNIDGLTALTKIFSAHENEEGYDEIVSILKKAKENYVQPLVPLSKARSNTPDGRPKIAEDPNELYFNDLVKRKGIFKYAAEGAKEITANYFVSGGNLESKPDIIFLAARNGHAELVDIILGLNPSSFDIDYENSRGLTMLLGSVGRGNIQVVESLLLKGANPLKHRKQDNLNALEIAERSPLFDIKEVQLIKNYVTKFRENKVKSDSPLLSTSVVNKKSEEPKGKEERETPKSLEEVRTNEDKIYPNRKANSVEHDHIKIKKVDSDPESKSETPNLVKIETNSDIENIGEHVNKSVRASTKTASPSPTAPSPNSIKLQEDLKHKNAEEARIWQEKVEAKKRARIDMFLKSEKEKEKKRKEEEAQKLKDEEESKKFQEQEEKRLAYEAEEKKKDLFEKKVALERDLVLDRYPIGLRYAKFNETLNLEDISRYSPLYIFELNNEEYIIDLQLALLTGVPTTVLCQKYNEKDKIPLTNDQKSKVWKLYFPFIGTDDFSNSRELASDNLSKFQGLFLNFIRLQVVGEVVKTDFPNTFKEVWDNKRLTKVNLDALELFKEVSLPPVLPEPKEICDPVALERKSFLPPSLRYRKDSLRVIYSSSSPLW